MSTPLSILIFNTSLQVTHDRFSLVFKLPVIIEIGLLGISVDLVNFIKNYTKGIVSSSVTLKRNIISVFESFASFIEFSSKKYCVYF